MEKLSSDDLWEKYADSYECGEDLIAHILENY